MHIFILFLLFFLVISNVDAGSQSIELTEKNKTAFQAKSESPYISKFAQWGDNEFLVKYTDDRKTRRHIDVSLGFRYLMTNSIVPSKVDEWDYAVAIAYQGEFDFFALTRESSPVVTTRHNPSIFYTRFRNPRFNRLSSWLLSLEHESNGQVTDTLLGLQSKMQEFAIDYQDDPDVSQQDIFEMAQQTISRSNNFAAVGFNYQLGNLQNECHLPFSCTKVFFKFRQQLDNVPEDDNWWLPNDHAKLKQHVGTMLDISTRFNAGNIDQSIRVRYQTGQLLDGGKPFDKHTFDLKYYVDVPVGRLLSSMFSTEKTELFSIPIVVRYHHGYLDELYNYSSKVSYFSIGLHARY